MTEPAPQPLWIRTNADFSWLFSCTNPDGTPFIFTGWTIKMSIAPCPGANAYITLETGATAGTPGIFFKNNDPTTGIFQVFIPASETGQAAEWAATTVYDIIAESNTSPPQTPPVAAGPINVVIGVTQP